MHAFTGNSAIDGVNAFRTKSLLNKRGSSCFTIGAIIARLQDFVDGNDEPTVWIVVNHNLIQRCVFVMCEGRYHVFKPTDRYVRWIPQCPREYLLIEEVVPFSTKDGESHAAVVLPTEEQLQLGIKQRDEFRQMVGLPIIEEGYQPILSPNMEYDMASQLHESSMSLDSTSGNKKKKNKSFTKVSRKNIYHLAFPKGTYVLRFSDLRDHLTNTIWMIENHVMIRKLVLESSLIPGKPTKFQMTNRYQGWYYDEPWEFMSLAKVDSKCANGVVCVIFPNCGTIEQAIDHASVLREKGNQKGESSRIQLERKVRQIKEIKSKKRRMP